MRYKKLYFTRRQKPESCSHFYCQRRFQLTKEQFPFAIDGHNIGCQENFCSENTGLIYQDIHYDNLRSFYSKNVIPNFICNNSREVQSILDQYQDSFQYIIHAPLDIIINYSGVPNYNKKIFFYFKEKSYYPQAKRNPSFFDFLPIECPSSHYYPVPNVTSKNNKSNIILFSVIIPIHRNIELFKITLEFLKRQEKIFELILIIDSSEEENLIPLLSSLKIPYKVVILPDEIKREIGGSGYRAGVARNWGAHFSQSQNLLFLDADILLPQNTLTILKKKIKEGFFYQAIRHHISISHCQNMTSKKFKKEWLLQNSNPSGDGFWEKFYNNKEKWSNLSYPWKYVSSYFLLINKKDFTSTGGFNSTFTSYGLEDTELGHRLIKNNIAPQLLYIDVIHQDHRQTRSEYNGKENQRHQILKKMAWHFYQLHLDPQIYNGLSFYLKER